MNSPYKIAGKARGLAAGLGWFGLVSGLLSVLWPRETAHVVGVRSRPLLFKLLGLRGILTGAGLLLGRKKGNWLWARVGGGAMDLALLGAATAQRSSNVDRIGAAMGAAGAVTLLDLAAALLHLPGKPVHLVRTIIVDRSPEELYGAWRNFANFPNFMDNVVAVQVRDERHSHWVVKAFGKTRAEWDAEITEDVPNEQISWRSLGGADVENWGTVQLIASPAGRGTMVRVTLDCRPPGGRFGALAAMLPSRTPKRQIDADLHRFAQWMETGFVTTTVGQPAGQPRGESILRGLVPK